MGFLEQKGLLHSIITQNIDALELKAGVNKDHIIFAHGNLEEAHCVGCAEYISIESIKDYIKNSKVLYCDKCNHPCKPKIVLYGEKMPETFWEGIEVKLLANFRK